MLIDKAKPAAHNNQRLMALDLFRGATIAAMILVNDPGDGPSAYWPLRHAEWNGWTPTDLIFPFFLFIVGVSLSFSLRSRMERGVSKPALMKHVLWRGLALFVLGIFLNGFPNHYHWATLRIYGVLQRIAICYVISSIMALWASRRTQIVAIVFCLAGYYALMRYVPVPGFGVPTHNVPLLDPDHNLAAWLDRKLLMGHLFDGTRDPEGLLSTIPAIATSLLGVLTGKWLRSERSSAHKLMGLFASGAIGLVAGEVFGIWFPINKKLWTSSYVLLTAGLALFGLGLCYWLADMKNWRKNWTTPLLVFGRNAITSYFLAELLASWLDSMQVKLDGGAVTWHEVIYGQVFAGLGSAASASLLYAIAYVVLCWAAMWVLYRKQIFLKI